MIGILGEYDALPGMSQAAVPYPQPLEEGAPGQACGHHLFGTASLAAAIAASENQPATLPLVSLDKRLVGAAHAPPGAAGQDHARRPVGKGRCHLNLLRDLDSE